MSSTLYKKGIGIISTTGLINTKIDSLQSGSYWLIIRATGYAPIASDQRVNIQSGVPFTYDFSRSATSVYQTTMLQQSGDRYLVKPGDFDANRRINSTDINLVKQNTGLNVSIIPAE